MQHFSPENPWMTAEEVDALTSVYPRVELWHGRLKVKTPCPPDKNYGKFMAEISAALGNWV